MLSRLFIAAALCLSFTAAAQAQNARVHVYGPITKVEGRTVTVMNRDGQSVTFDLAPQGRIVSDQPLDVKTIKVGDSIAFPMAPMRRVNSRFGTIPPAPGISAW